MGGWVRLQPAESATTSGSSRRKMLLTDGPFVDSKEFLGGLILVEAETSRRTRGRRRAAGLDVAAAIEVRPVFEQELGGLKTSFGISGGACSPRWSGSRRHRARRGRGTGSVRAGGGTVAARWPAGEPDRLADRHARNRAIHRIRRQRTLAIKTKQLERELTTKDRRRRWTRRRRHLPTSGSS